MQQARSPRLRHTRGQIATLILPGDTAWQDAGEAVVPQGSVAVRGIPDPARVEAVAKVLRSGEPTLLLIANKATRGRSLALAGQVAAGTGCRVGTQFFSARIERGAGRTPLERIPYAVAAGARFSSPVSSTS